MAITTAVLCADFVNPYWEPDAPRVGGLLLLERQILSLAKIGVKNILVVIAAKDSGLRHFLQSRSWPVVCTVVENPDAASNPVSWLGLVAGRVSSPFLAISGACLADKNFLKNLCHGFDGSVPHTFVIKNGGVQPVAIFSQSIFADIATAATFADLWTHLQTQGLARASEADPYFCEVLQNLNQRKQAQKFLLQSCRKDTDGFISRHLNRRISLWISARLMNTSIHANWLTLLTSIVGLVSGYLAVCATAGTYAWAGILFNLASILDGVDGELARIRLADSKLGQWLDTLSDNSALVAFMGGTLWGLRSRQDLPVPQWLFPTALTGLLMLFFVMVYFLLKYTESGSLVAIKQKLESLSGLNPIVAAVVKLNFLIRRDFFATAVMVVAVFDKPHWVILGLALATHTAWVFLLGVLVFGRRHLLQD